MDDLREFWKPGEMIRDIFGHLSHDHIVIATLFTGQGNTGVIRSQSATGHAVWDVDERGTPRVRSFHDGMSGGAEGAQDAFRERVAQLLAPDDMQDKGKREAQGEGT